MKDFVLSVIYGFLVVLVISFVVYGYIYVTG
jgi:hypothetical protein